MLVSKETVEIDSYKPNMKNLNYLEDVPLEATTVSAKLDGEFTLMYHDESQTFIVNRYGTTRRNFPAINEAREILLQAGLNKAVFKLEHYALGGDGKPLKVNEFSHIAKSCPEQHDQLRFAYFDIVALRGISPVMTYSEKLDVLETIFKDATYNHVVPYIEPESTKDVVEFWDIYVEKLGYEGIIVNKGSTRRKEGTFMKLKPLRDVDCVILGINKKPKFREQLVTSLKLGVIDEDGDFIVVGDVASGISHELRSYLWKLTQLEVKATMWNSEEPYMESRVLWIKPCIVVAVSYQEVFDVTSAGNPVVKDKVSYRKGRYVKVAETVYPSLRHPRFMGVRGDKKVIYTDISSNQI